MVFFDSHCHLDLVLKKFPQLTLQTLLKETQASGVSNLLSVATSIQNCDELLALLAPFETLKLSCGVHPLSLIPQLQFDTLLTACHRQRVVAIGETGLDYYKSEAKAAQINNFEMHLEVAKETQKPIIIHTRLAAKDTLNCCVNAQRQSGKPLSGVIHCFSEDMAFAKAALDLGLFISFSGIVTFQNGVTLRQVAQYVPQDRLLIETDAPYLTPEPYRGRPNLPAYVKQVAQTLATVRYIPIEAVAAITTQNAQRLFQMSEINLQ